MLDSLLLPLVLLSLLIGGLIAWLLAKLRFTKGMLPPSEVEQRYVLRELYEHLQQQTDAQKADLQEKQNEIRDLATQLTTAQQDLKYLHEKLNNQQQEVEKLQQQARIEFENLANRLLEEKSQKFTSQNTQQLNDLLNPLREKIKDFEDSIERKFIDEAKDRISLKTEIENLRQLNQQLSQDANNLATALKGDNKTQGDWGEFRLELLLEKAGLTKDVHYRAQPSFLDEGGQQKRPDFIIELPGNKHLILDSKVSLVAYEQFYNANDDNEKQRSIKAHCESLRKHIKDLSEKNYQHLYQINSPDYLLLFIPIEPAFSIAVQHDNKLFLDALDRNIVIVTTSTLLATMRTVSYIWKQEKQKNNVIEIARQSGLLYDKLCAFVEDLRTLGQRLDLAQNAYHDAMNKLVDSRKHGHTLLGRAEKIKSLGAKTSKHLPQELIDGLNDNENGVEETLDDTY
ncbi:MAG: DNA recombination protein RmuC [Saprospiraceae bacterium]|nr:DNA recombination protein RmuC [Saprospiraceae bacterium]